MAALDKLLFKAFRPSDLFSFSILKLRQEEQIILIPRDSIIKIEVRRQIIPL